MDYIAQLFGRPEYIIPPLFNIFKPLQVFYPGSISYRFVKLPTNLKITLEQNNIVQQRGRTITYV
jgi:hypothetical protein